MTNGMQKCAACHRGRHDRCSWGNCACYAIDIDGHENPYQAEMEARDEAYREAREYGRDGA